ncbi:MAG: HAD-IA family hydrolase [Chloroflexota bacterium]|nr:HAD-IA family hydrolase [Chloroflexota bacterium]
MRVVVVFDIFGVLLSRSFASSADSLSLLLNRSAAEIKTAYVRWEHPWDRGQITAVDFWSEVQAELGTGVDWQVLDNAVLNSIHPLPGSLQLLARCGENTDTYLLSDTRREWFQTLDDRFGLRRRVRRAFLSFEMGLGKSDPGCFEFVLAEIGCQPGDVTFLDDRATNITAARRLGIKAIKFSTAAAVEEELCS